VQQLFAHQIFQRVAKSKPLLYKLLRIVQSIADKILFLTLPFLLSFRKRTIANSRI
jgi:hypothetical protein